MIKKLFCKLSSRKFWMAAAGVATGIAMAFGVEGGTIATVAGAVTAVASVVTYVITEGRIDAESVKQAVEAVQGTMKLMVDTEKKSDDAADRC